MPRFGHWQKAILTDLLAGREVANPTNQLRGNAKLYVGRYRRSFQAVLSYLEAQGYGIVLHPGPRGGMSSATYQLDFPALQPKQE